MNHDAAMSITPRQRCLTAILRFLHDEGLSASLAALESESKQTFVDADEDDANSGGKDFLVNAVMMYHSHRRPFKVTAQQRADTHAQSIINALKLMYDDRPVGITAHTLTPHSGNIVAVAFPHAATAIDDNTLVATGGVDKQLVISDYTTGDVQTRIGTPGPVLSIAFNPIRGNEVVVGCMGGQCVIIDTNEFGSKSIRQSFHHHNKYTVAVDWSMDGRIIATASHDGKVAILIRETNSAVKQEHNTTNTHGEDTSSQHDDNDRDDYIPFILRHTFEYRNPIESICFLNDHTLLICPREDNYVHVVSLTELRETCRMNLNATGDDHVSFSVLHCAPNHTGSLVALATDQHRLLIISTQIDLMLQDDAGAATTASTASSSSSSIHQPQSLIALQVRNYWGLSNDGYSTPRCAWSAHDKFVYVSTNKTDVCVYDVSSDRAINTLRGHEINCRSLATHHKTGVLATCSFDKNVKIWKPQE